MRKKVNVEQTYTDDPVQIVNFDIPWIVQPPTFATVSDAYSYFTRHMDDFPVPDFADDSDDELPNFVTSDVVDDLLVDGPARVLDGVASPVEAVDDGQRADEERESDSQEANE